MLNFSHSERSAVSFNYASYQQEIARLLLAGIFVLDVYALLEFTVLAFVKFDYVKGILSFFLLFFNATLNSLLDINGALACRSALICRSGSLLCKV